MKYKIGLLAMASLSFGAAPAFADDPAAPAAAAPAPTPTFTITGSADIASQYKFRGISQSDNKAVAQASFTITHASGFYISTWGSSASANNAVNIGGTEIDLYAGYSHAFKSGLTIDGGLYGYIYPGSGRAVGISENYYELYGDVSKAFGPLTAKVGANWAPKQSYFKNFATATRYNTYVYGELGFALPGAAWSLHSHVGHTGGGFDYVGHQYLDFTVGASYKWKALTFDISAVGTNIKRSYTAPFDVGGSHDFWRSAKTMPVGTITASF
jgi:uncharacterized protein (TIGR02001 family)